MRLKWNDGSLIYTTDVEPDSYGMRCKCEVLQHHVSPAPRLNRRTGSSPIPQLRLGLNVPEMHRSRHELEARGKVKSQEWSRSQHATPPRAPQGDSTCG